MLPGRDVVAVVTLTLVIARRPGVRPPRPSSSDRSVTRPRRRSLASSRGWTFRADGSSQRRVVPSPEPLRVLELNSSTAGTSGHGSWCAAAAAGCPSSSTRRPIVAGVDAVVDKDLTSAVLAEALGAERLLLLTDVPGVERDHGTPEATVVRSASIGELRGGGYPDGSMGPKVEAACRFAERTGHRAVIGSLDDAVALFAGSAGTVVCPATFA